MASERAVPIWFGPRVSPLFGVVHMPDERARGAVVLCPPLGREYICSHSTFTKLAIRLAQLGFVALDSITAQPAIPSTEQATAWTAPGS